MNNNTLKLPHELIVEILLRLPVRSLLRFKCVCKLWLFLISDPQFAKSRFDLAAAPSHRLLFRATATDDGFIQSIDTEASLHDDSAVVKFRIPPPKYEYKYNPPCSPNDAVILGSCRGLVLLYYRFIDHLILWNPSTGAYNRLPWTWGYPIITKEFNYGLAYDASTDDYLLIFMPSKFDNGWEPRVFLHYLKINSWKRSKDVIKFDYYSISNHFRVGSLFNGAVHWLVRSQFKENAVIVAFDLEEKTSSTILLPPPIDVEYNTYELYDLTVVGGCLSVCSSVQGQGRYEIWMMKEYKVESSWTKYLVISKYHIPYNPFTPIYITKDGAILGSNFCRRLERLNDKGKFLEDLSYVGNFAPQTHMYIESLLSPMIVNGETSNKDQ